MLILSCMYITKDELEQTILNDTYVKCQTDSWTRLYNSEDGVHRRCQTSVPGWRLWDGGTRELSVGQTAILVTTILYILYLTGGGGDVGRSPLSAATEWPMHYAWRSVHRQYKLPAFTYSPNFTMGHSHLVYCGF